jgi:hypothetical protein
MATDLARVIRAHTERVNALHRAVDEAAARRRQLGTPAAVEEWQRAARAFSTYDSDVWDQLERIDREGLEHDQTLREFAFAFLDVDPMHFRSGYAKERLLQRIKALDLAADEVKVLRSVILRRIEGRALREFRRYCRLLPRITDNTFGMALVALSHSPDGHVRAHASFALRYLPDELKALQQNS